MAMFLAAVSPLLNRDGKKTLNLAVIFVLAANLCGVSGRVQDQR